MTAWLRTIDDRPDLPLVRRGLLRARVQVPRFAVLAGAGLVLFAAILMLAGAASVPGVIGISALGVAVMAGGFALRPDPASGPMPPVPVTGQVRTGSVASDVLLDYDRGTAEKIYRPTFAVKLLYALSFQSRFPYTDNVHAFEAARLRREIAGLLTEAWYGERIVVPALEVRPSGDGRFVFVTELVRGTFPRDRSRARAFLNGLSAHFQEAGLPPWQVASYNPRAIGNLIEQCDGSYRVIDLESNLVTPFLPPAALVRAIRAGQYPAFDDIDVARLRRYLAAHRDTLVATLGAARADRLAAAAEEYGAAQGMWHASERRIASKTLRFALRLVDVPGWFRAVRRLATGGERLAESVTHRGIDTWVAEGLLTEPEARAAREQLATPEMTAATAHLGAHLAITVPLRFPFGSIARTAWTLALRARGEWDALRGKAPATTARRVHSLPVAALAAIPGFGSFAYLAAKPFRQEPVIRAVAFDQALRHTPLRAYERLHLRAYTRSMAAPSRRSRARFTTALRTLPVLAVITVAAAAGMAALAGSGLSGAELRVVGGGAIALAGVVSVAAFMRFWSAGESRPLSEQAGNFFWLVAGAGLAALGIDIATNAHVVIADAIDGLPMVPGAGDLHVMMLAGYLVTAAAVAWAFRDELTAPRLSSQLILVAGALAAAALAFEAVSGDAAFAALASSGVVMVAAAATRFAETTLPMPAHRAAMPGRRLPHRVERGLSRLEPSVRELARSRALTLKLLAVSTVVVALSVGAGRAIFGEGEEHQLFRDIGPVTFFSSALLATAGLIGVIAWQRDRDTTGRRFYGDLWAAWGLGFIALAIEAPLDVHGKLGWAIATMTGIEHPAGFNATSDAIIAVYGLAGLAVTAVLWRQIFDHPMAIARFAAAVPAVGLMIAVDGFLGHSALMWVFEESVELVAAAFFFSGFAERYRRSVRQAVKPARLELPNGIPVAA